MGNVFNPISQSYNYFPFTELVSYPVYFFTAETRLTSLQMRLVSERKLKRIQRRQFRNLQTKIFNLWEEFRNGERSAKQLLSAISYLIAPSQ